jgi:cytoskeletal protein RodZ
MADIGSTLREARMRTRIDISEVETKTKIRAKYLRAIENEEWDLLPGPVYVKSFLRTYGDYLGLDSRLLVDEFKRRYERPSDHDARPLSSISRERERAARGPLLPSWAIIGAVLVAVVIALWALGQGSKKTPPPVTGAKVTHKHGGRRHRTHRQKTKTTTAPTTAAVVTLKLAATGPLYACVENSHGKVLVPALTYDAGQTIPTAKGTKLLVTLGNNAVQMDVDGKPYPVAASANAIGLDVQASGVTPLAAGKAPTCR